MNDLLFRQIEKAQDQALTLGDLKTCTKLNWLKYSIDFLDSDVVFFKFQQILTLGV